MKTYQIERTSEGVKLFRIEHEGRSISRCYDISPKDSQRLVNHSPDGFEFGYHGSGPAQLALAILLDCFHDAADPRLIALEQHQAFKDAFIVTQDIKSNGFEITERQIVNWFAARVVGGTAS